MLNMETPTHTVESKICYVMCNDQVRDDEFETAISKRAQESISWLNRMSKTLSKLGIDANQPDDNLRTSKSDAKFILQACQSDLEKREKHLKKFLITAKAYIQKGERGLFAHSKLENHKASTTKYDIEELGRSYRSSVCESRSALFDGNKEGLDFFTAQDSQGVLSERHLELIDKLWSLLCVQIKILSIQLCRETRHWVVNSAGDGCNKFDRFGYNFVPEAVNVCSDVDGRAALTLVQCPESDNFPSYRTQLGSRLNPSKDKSTLDIMASDITEHNEVNVGHQFSSEDCQKSQISAEGSSPRDDGYDSKAGESVVDESNFDDDDKDTSTADGETITTDVDSALQLSQSLNLNSLHESETEKATEIEKSPQRDQSKEETGAIEEAVDDGARVYHSSFSDEQWDQIYEVLERFSQNTMTLMSWIDELRDLDSEDPTGPSFYDSNSSRKRNIITHTQRVYENVIEDAAMLLKNLPSEKTTILIVLQKVELKCEGLNVCNSDDITELSNIQSSVDVQDHAFLSSKLKSELVDPLASYDDFKPIVTSTPKRSLNKSTPAQRSPATPKKTTRFLDPVEFNPAKKETTALSYRIPAARPSTHQSRRGWNDFISEYNDTLEWLERMENMIRQTELSDVLTEDADLLLEKYYLEFSMNSSKRQTLEVKGNYLSVVYPELKRDVRRKLNDVESFWDSLKLRLDDDYRLLPLTPVTRLERKERIRLLRPYRFERYSLYRPSHYHVSVRKQSLPLPIPEVQLSDFSLHQIRDQLGFGPTLRHKSLLKDEQRANRFDVRRSLHPYLPSPSTDFLNPLRPSIRPHLTESNSGDTEFRGRIFMSPYRKFNCPYRRTHPRVGPVTTTEKSLFNEKREGETIRGPLKSITKYIRTDDKEESDIFSTNPLLLSSRIIEFQAWLAEEELDTYNKSSPPLGWSPTILQKFLRENQVLVDVLQERHPQLKRILLSAKKVLETNNTQLVQVDENTLLWVCVMIQLRFLNLVLYSLDLECILERRIDVIAKDNLVHKVAHPIEDVWNDRQIDMSGLIELFEDNYNILRNEETK